MKFRVEVICVNNEGAEQRCEVMEMERQELAMETLGLSLAEGKALLRGVQDFVASQQISEDLKRRHVCPNCGERHPSKAAGTSTVETVFGPVAVPNPRWERCSCQTESPKTFRPTATWLRGRTSPERLYLETKWALRGGSISGSAGYPIQKKRFNLWRFLSLVLMVLKLKGPSDGRHE
jgi:hypothetical protein